MSIMDFFKETPAAQPATEVKQPEAAADIKADAAKAETPVNPMDAYKEMLDNANKDSGIHAPSFKLDPTKLGEVAKGMDFTRGIDPSLMEKAVAGDAKSLLAVIQSVGQNAYSASLEHATNLTDAHLGSRADYDRSRLDQGVKQQLTSNALSAAPNYNHPVVKAELNRVANQFAAANPDSSPQEIAEAAQRYINDLSSALKPQEDAATVAASKEMDWTSYLK